jgi:hypothetical protein
MDEGCVVPFLKEKSETSERLLGFSPLANYTDRAIAAGQRS